MALEEPARRLVLIRHAKSDYPPGVPDHDRPLNDRGRRDAPEVGRWLGGHLGWSGGAAPLVLVSSAVRAQQSWTLAQQHLPAAWSAATTRTEPLIYEASVRTLLAIVSSVPTDVLTVVMVGHNPGLADLIDRTCVDDDLQRAATEKFPTSSVAVLECVDDWPTATAVPGAFRVTQFAAPRG